MTDFLPFGRCFLWGASGTKCIWIPNGGTKRPWFSCCYSNCLLDCCCGNVTSDVAQYLTWLPFHGFGPCWVGTSRLSWRGGESDWKWGSAISYTFWISCQCKETNFLISPLWIPTQVLWKFVWNFPGTIPCYGCGASVKPHTTEYCGFNGIPFFSFSK